jgi:hypothetical protein
MKTPAERLAQVEKDIEDHKEAELIEHDRANRERANWTAADKADFATARKASAEHLMELVQIRDELRREVGNDHQTP